MTYDRKKRLFQAGTVTAIMLLFILIAVMAYQLVAIGVKNNRLKKLEYEIISLTHEQEKLTDDIGLYSSKYYIEDRAKQLHMVRAED